MSVKVKDVLDALHQMQKSLECSICLELLKDPHSTKCNHQFCGQCIRQVLEKSSKKSKNKWYCPLCKTPVSKRSLTPNPKLGEIVAAVRNLREAVQEDTGIPTGSPPSQPLKSSSTSDHAHLASHHSTPRKCNKGTKSNGGKRSALTANPFNVFLENNDVAGEGLERQQSKFVSNINIRPSFGPAARTSKKLTNTRTTRVTRSTRRTEGNSTDTNRKNASDELLRMIDTMPFQPVLKGDSSCPGEELPMTPQKQVPVIDELQPNQCVEHGSCPEDISKAFEANTDAEKDYDKAAAQPDKTICSTTIAEADSSIKTSPCENHESLFGKRDSCHTAKEHEGVVSSTRFDSATQSSLDTMQSVSLLPSFDGHNEECDMVPVDVCSVQSKEGFCLVIEEGSLISLKHTSLDNQENPLPIFVDTQTGEHCDKTLTVNVSGSNKNRTASSMDFEGLVSLFEDPCFSDTKQEWKKPNVELDATHGRCLHVEDCSSPGTHFPGDLGKKETEVDMSSNVSRSSKNPAVDFDGLVSLCEDPCSSDTEQKCRKPEDVEADAIVKSNRLNESASSSPQGCEREELCEKETVLCSSATEQKCMKPKSVEADAATQSKCLKEGLSPSPQGCGQEELCKKETVPCSSDTEQKCRKPEGVEADAATQSKCLKEGLSPSPQGRGQEELSKKETSTASDLYKRVKQRRRRRTSELLHSNQCLESPSRSNQLKLKTKKRAVHSVVEPDCVGVSPDESARKKFKNAEESLDQFDSVLEQKRSKKSEMDSVPSECKEVCKFAASRSSEDAGPEWDGDSGLSVGGRLLSDSNKFTPSGEVITDDIIPDDVIPASVSSSETCVINPMIPHVNQQSESTHVNTVNNTERCLLQQTDEKQGGEKNDCNKPSEGLSQELLTTDVILQGEASRDKEEQRNSQTGGRGGACCSQEFTDFKACEPCLDTPRPSLAMTVCQGGSPKANNSEEGEEGRNLEDEGGGRTCLGEAPATYFKASQTLSLREKLSATASDVGSQEGINVVREDLKSSPLEDQDIHVLHSSQTLVPDTRTPEPVSPNQQLLESVSNVDSQERMKLKRTRQGTSQTNGRVRDSSQERRRNEKISQPLSQKQTPESSNSTPTQSSLEVDAVTPCLFGSETPERKMRQKRTRTQASPTTPQERIVSYDDNTVRDVLRDSGTPDLKNGTSQEKNTSALSFKAKTIVKGNNSSQAEKEVKTFSDGNQHAHDNVRVLDQCVGLSASLESCSTSQSISVLQDLDLIALDDDKTNVSDEELQDVCYPAQDHEARNNGENSCVEPFPKKPRICAILSPPQERAVPHPGRGLGTLSCDDSQDTECMESDVIPPTPPVKPASKPVCSSRVQSPSLRLSRSKEIQQRKDKQVFHSAHVSEKPAQLLGKPGRLESTKFQVEEDGEQCSSMGSSPSEWNISLLKNRRKPAAKGWGSECDGFTGVSLNANKNQKKKSQVKRLGDTLSKPSRNLSQSLKFRKRAVYSEENTDPVNVEEKRQSQISKRRSQVSSLNPSDGNTDDRTDCSPFEVESVNSSPCDFAKEEEKSTGDSFYGPQTNDTCGEKGDSQEKRITLDNDDSEEVEIYDKDNGDGGFLHDNNDFEEDSFIKHQTGKARENEGDCVIVDNSPKKSPCEALESDEGDSQNDEEDSLSDEEDSSGEEALLRSVFLPKDPNLGKDESDGERDMNCEGDEPPAFSQELISSQEDEQDDGIASSCKAMDSTGASSTFMSEAAASTQKMEVLRHDVEAMEREMEELRAYLAKNDENKGEAGHRSQGDNVSLQSQDHCEDPDILPSLSPPPPLTPKSIPPLPQLSSPLKDVSRYLDQEGQSSDEDSDWEEMPGDDRAECVLTKNSREKEKTSSNTHTAGKPALFESLEEDELSITAVEHRQEETPSRPRNRSKHKSSCDEDELIVLDDRDASKSGSAGSLLLVKRRKLSHDLIPKKSPVVSLLFTNTAKNSERASQSSRSVGHLATKRPSSFNYGRTVRPKISSPVNGQSGTGTESRDLGQSPGSGHTKLRVVTNTKDRTELERSASRTGSRTQHLSFVATRLNRRQLAEARGLAEKYGGKLASEFNSKTSHVILATDENMQVTRHSYTMKYLLGLALGKWIVSHHWITACIQAKQLVPEADYEVKGDLSLGQASIPRLARMARHTKKALLFEDFDVLCAGSFSAAVTKEQLSQLLKFCGARVHIDAENQTEIEKDRRKVVVIDKENSDSIKEVVAICHQLKTSPVSLEWVTDSIANYRVQDFRDYVIAF